MKVLVFSILDNAIEAFNAPFTARTEAEARRNFALASTKDANIMANARDYVLYEIGSFDDSSGMVSPLREPRRVVSVADLIAQRQDDPTGTA